MIDQFSGNPLFNITVMVGVIFVAAGFIMWKFPPKQINFLYGYRTSRSMKNQESWDFAQKYAAKEMMKTGLVLAASGLLAFIFDFGSSVNLLVGCMLVFLAVVILVIRVEKAIKKRFDKWLKLFKSSYNNSTQRQTRRRFLFSVFGFLVIPL